MPIFTCLPNNRRITMEIVKRLFTCLTLLLISAASAHAVTVTATSSGKWNQPGTWSSGSVPASTDNVIINTGVTVKITDDYTCASLIVNGTMEFNQNEKGNLIVTGDVIINSGGMVQTLLNATDKQQSLSIGGSLSNNGSMDLCNSASTFVQLTFNGSTSANWIMNSGSFTDVAPESGVVVNKGASMASLLTATFNSNFTVNGSASASFLRLANGLCTFTGNQSISNSVFSPTNYSIPATAGFRLNSSAFTILGQSGTCTNSGLLRISLGTCTIGTTSGNLLTGNGSFLIDGGTLNIASRFSTTSGTFTQSSGTVNVCTVGNSASGTYSFDMASGSSFIQTGGSLNLVQANSSLLNPLDFRLQTTSVTASGGALYVGSSSTATNFSFRLAGAVPILVVDNTGSNKTALIAGATTGFGSVTINPGSTLNTNLQTFSARGASFVNNGALSGSGTLSFDGSIAQAYSGSGSVAANITITNTSGLALSTGISFAASNTLTVAGGALLDAKTYLFSFGLLGNVVVNGTLYTSNTAGFSGSASTTIVSTNAPTITLGSSSTVIYNSASSQNVTPRAYANLTITAAGVKSLTGNATIGNGNTLSVAASSTLSAANNSISFGTSASAAILGTFRTANSAGFTGSTSTSLSTTNNPTVTLGSASTVQYNGSASQVISARTDYAHLTISGSRSVGSSITLASGTIGLTGAFTASATNAAYIFTGNTVNYKGSGQLVAAFDYNDLSLAGASGTTFPSGTVSISGVFTPAAITSASQGTINYKGSSQTVAAFNYYNLDFTSATGMTFPSGTVGIAGVFTKGATTTASQGTVYLNSGAQTVPAFGFYNLSLSSGTKTMSGAVSVAGNLVLSGVSRLLLGASSLSVSGTVTGDASNYVVTDGAGSVVLRGVTGAGKVFPIGATAGSYSPLTIAQASSLDWTVRVGSDINPTAVNRSYAIQRMWSITPSINPTPSGSTLTFQYNEADAGIQGANWSTSALVALSRHNGTTWSTAASGISAGGTPGAVRTVTASGLIAFSSWVISKSSTPLPVELLSFTGQREATGNKLQWSTASESDNAGFSLERSEDGRNFYAIAFVPSQAPGGNSSTLLSYQFRDARAGMNRYFYRLRQQNLNNTFSYSGVVRIDANDQANGIIALAPNPSRGSVQVQLRAGTRTQIQVALYDARGRLLHRSERILEAGNTVFPLTLDGLAAGDYLFRVQFGDGTISSQQLLKQ